MNETGFSEFNATVSKTNQLLKEIEAGFGWEERRNQSYAALRAVLHTLRDRMTIEESAQFSAQLPLLIKGIYYDGWDPTGLPRKMNKEEFLQAIRQQFPFSIEGNIEDVIGVVLRALRKHISYGEAEDVLAILPKDIAQMLA